MNGITCVGFGKELFSNISKIEKRETITKNGQTYNKIVLNTKDLLQYTKDDDYRIDKYYWGEPIYSFMDYTMEILHKAKSNYEVLLMSLKSKEPDGKRGAYETEEVYRGAISKTTTKKGEIVKFHITERDVDLYTGNTRASGKLEKSRKSDVFSEKYIDYLWKINDRDLMIISDYYGLFGDKKSPEEIADMWGIKKKRVEYIAKSTARKIRYVAIQNWRPPFRETKKSHYTIWNYVNSLKELRDYSDWKYMRELDKCTVDEKTLKEYARIRQHKEIINEWREETKKLR